MAYGNPDLIHPDLFPFFLRILDLMSGLKINSKTWEGRQNFNDEEMKSFIFEFHDFYIMCGLTKAIIGKDAIAQEMSGKMTRFISDSLLELRAAEYAKVAAKLRKIEKQRKFWGKFIQVLEGLKTHFSYQTESADDINGKTYKMLAILVRCIHEVMLPLTSDGKFRFMGNQDPINPCHLVELDLSQQKVVIFINGFCACLKPADPVLPDRMQELWLSLDISAKLNSLYSHYEQLYRQSGELKVVDIGRNFFNTVRDEICQWNYTMSLCSLPNAPVLVFLPDFMCSTTMTSSDPVANRWSYIVGCFNSTHTVLNVTGLNFNTTLRIGSVNLEQIKSSFINLLQRLKINQASIIGDGIGGLIALEAAKNMPILNKLVAINTPLGNSYSFRAHTARYPDYLAQCEPHLLWAFRNNHQLSDRKEYWKQYIQTGQRVLLLFCGQSKKWVRPDAREIISTMPIGTVSCKIFADEESDVTRIQQKILVELEEFLMPSLSLEARLLHRSYSHTGLPPIGLPEPERNMPHTGDSPRLKRMPSRRHTV